MAFVVSEGSVTGVHRPTPPPPGTIRLADNLTQDYATLYRTQPQVRTVVQFLARNIADIGLHVFRRVSDNDRERLADHPLAQLLTRPNPRTTRYRAINALVCDIGIFDRGYWLKVTAGSERRLLRLPPSMVTGLGGTWDAPEKFRLKGNRGFLDVDPERIVYFRGYSPTVDVDHCSPIETLRRTLAEEYAAGAYRDQLLRNGARLSGYIQRPLGAPEWSEVARNRFKAGWRAQYSSNGSDAGGTPILEDGMEFQANAATPEQAQYLEARKLTREEVAAAYFVPPPMVGILDHATFSNITEQHKNLYQDTLAPWLTMMAEEIELQLLPDFPDTRNVYVEFNMAKKLEGSFEEQAKQLQTSVGAPWLTRNEARARLNLPQLEGGDDLVTPLNVIIGGQVSPTDSAPPQGE